MINPLLTANINVVENSGVPNDKIICKYDTGIQTTLTAIGSGGTPTYTYDWSPQNGSNMILTTSPNATTSYTVDIEDAVGCTASTSETLEIPYTPIIWTGPTNRNWYANPNFWSFGRFPTVCDDVIIPNGKLVNLRAGYHGWANTLEVEGRLDTKDGTELDVVTQE